MSVTATPMQLTFTYKTISTLNHDKPKLLPDQLLIVLYYHYMYTAFKAKVT